MALSVSPDLSLLRGAVSDILGGQGQVAADTAAATGQQYAAQGAQVEQDAYTKAAAIAQQNAQLQGVAGQIEEAQTQREVAATIGAERAGVASAGFGKSGTALDLLASSTRQGILAGQMIRTQTQLDQGAQLEELNAAQMEAQAAGIKGQAATALGAAYTTAAGTAQTQAQQETQALMGYLASVGAIGGTPNSPSAGGNLTPEAGVALSSLKGVPGVPNVPTPKWQQGPDGTWQYGGTGTGAGAGTGIAATSGFQIGGPISPYSWNPLGNAGQTVI